jgi:hypothetical protein
MFRYLAPVICIALGFFSIVFSTSVKAQVATGAADQYSVQVNEVALCSDSSCSTVFILGNSPTTFDIASAAAGADVGSFSDAAGLQLGAIFTHIRITISRTITVDGSITDGGNLAGIANTTCRTSAANDGGAAANATTAADGSEGTGTANTAQALFVPSPLSFGGGTLPTNASYTDEGVTIPLGASTLIVTKALTDSFTVAEEPPSIKVSFNTATALGAFNGGANDCKMIPQPPTMSITIN